MNSKEIIYDVIIPAGKKDINFVPRVVDLISRCLNGVGHIYILTNQNHIAGISRKLSVYKQCVLIDENELLEGLSFSEVRKFIGKYAPQHVVLTGWYFQQFLKLGFALSRYSNEYYLSWDADTLPLAPIEFFEGEHILFNPKYENHLAYFDTMNRLLGFGRQSDVSYISESMMFCVNIVREMISRIDNSGRDSNWFEQIIKSCDFKKSPQAFSEFETYGNYCAKYYPGLYKPRYLNTFREAGLIRGRYIKEKHLREMSFDLDMASFELQNRPCFPYNIPNIIWLLDKKLSKIKNMSVKEIAKIVLSKISEDKQAEEGFYRLPDRTVMKR